MNLIQIMRKNTEAIPTENKAPKTTSEMKCTPARILVSATKEASTVRTIPRGRETAYPHMAITKADAACLEGKEQPFLSLYITGGVEYFS